MVRFVDNSRHSTAAQSFSLGAWVIVALAIASSLGAVWLAAPVREGLEMWLFARDHYNAYRPAVEDWNRNHDVVAHLYVLSVPALERRMQSGFLSGTPVADLLEVDVNAATRAFNGPHEDIGFVDLTDRLRAEGVFDEINEPSFSPWTVGGRVYGIPHDVHPVMLCYRADLVEAAGIDVTRIETWDDFARELRPLIEDVDGDGRVDRYLLNIWHQQYDPIEALQLQAGGRNFDDDGRVVIDSEINAHVVSTLASWMTGPNRIAIDAEEFTPAGNRLKIDGLVVASLMPDWLGGVWKNDVPQLAGKVKLMPLPAWKPGGRRTSVWGGSMLGIARTADDVDTSWEFAKQLYLSEPAARRLFENNGIISPVRRLWSESFYDAPDPYFSGQPVGRMFIELADDVPRRTSSPYNKFAKERFRDALTALRAYAEQQQIYDPAELKAEARRQLRVAHDTVKRHVERHLWARDER
jgi:arabinosaccharide transport system substrate-binding protein